MWTAAAAAGTALLLGGAGAAPPPPPAAWAATAPHAEGPPAGYTGGFGEATCLECHGEYAPNLDGSLVLEGLPPVWSPGATYVLTLVLESEGMERAGFQAAVRSTGGRPVGRLEPVDEDVVVRRPEAGGIPYVQHAPGARWTDGSAVTSWSFQWTAPDGAGATDTVRIHAAANSANGDDSPFGDLVYTVQAESVGGG